jgi:hypothetical protein
MAASRERVFGMDLLGFDVQAVDRRPQPGMVASSSHCSFLHFPFSLGFLFAASLVSVSRTCGAAASVMGITSQYMRNAQLLAFSKLLDGRATVHAL